MSKFKVGDKVKVVSETSSFYRVGDVGTISRMSGNVPDYLLIVYFESDVEKSFPLFARQVELVTPPVFDISAPLERQRTKNGRKLLYLMDTGEDVDQPLVALREGDCTIQTYCKNGRYYTNTDINANTGGDLITLPEEVVTTLHVKEDGSVFTPSIKQNNTCIKATTQVLIDTGTIPLKVEYNGGTKSVRVFINDVERFCYGDIA